MRGGHAHTPILPQWELLCAYDSKLWINSPWMGSAFGGNDLGQNVTASDYWPSWSSGGRTGGAAWGASIPIWNALALLVPATTLAWLFDTLARRRAHLNLCPACHYDRTGLPPQSPCPECASPP